MKRVTQGEAVRASLCVVLAAPLLAAHAAEFEAGLATATAPPAPPAAASATVVVTGKRASLLSARAIQREELGVVDVVVAEEIQKLPDFSLTEALQRVTGVQIARDRGEGGAVAVRGLGQNESTLNGREVFTAGAGRTLDFADIPAEMVASIRVHKTASADQIEGGVGGTIDLRTRRPFDFAGGRFVASTRLVQGDLVGGSKPQFSSLASQRWGLGSVGELGALLSLSHQVRAWREDQKSAGNPTLRTDLLPGVAVTAPIGSSETTSVGERTRSAGSLVLQWRVSPALEFYAEGMAARFETRQDSRQINLQAAPGHLAGSATLFAGTTDLRSITWTNSRVSILSFARDTQDRTRQAAAGGQWREGPLTVHADLSRTRSANTLFFSGPVMAGTVARFTQDLSGRVPDTSVAGTDLLAPASLRYTSVAYRSRRFEGELDAGRLDAEYRLPAGFFSRLSAGLRTADRRASNAPGLIFADAQVTGIGAADRPDSVLPNPYADFLPGTGARSVGHYLVSDLGLARNAPALREAFGVTAPLPASANPASIWRISERSQAAYLMGSFSGWSDRLEGRLGARLLHTRRAVSGSQVDAASSSVVPAALQTVDNDLLPSASLRYAASRRLTLRAAVSRTLARPNFDQLSPSLILLRNSIDPALNQGLAGDPSLRPLRADNLDLAVDAAPDAATTLTLTGFAKRVDGFVTTVSAPESHGGETYQVIRPQNSASARIQGFELGYQQLIGPAGGWLDGAGLQANYTLVQSRTPSAVLGREVPLQNLSRHSANLVGLYERGALSARVAYNWRSRFLSSVGTFVGIGGVPIYTAAYGWLDASATYRVNRQLAVSVEGGNLLRTLRRSFYGVTTRPESRWLNDRQLSLSASVAF